MNSVFSLDSEIPSIVYLTVFSPTNSTSVFYSLLCQAVPPDHSALPFVFPLNHSRKQWVFPFASATGKWLKSEGRVTCGVGMG
jgi:hypothetical protein